MASILITEDDEKTAQHIAQQLEAAGHEVDVETTGAGALERLREGGHDMIILDIMLPDISGFEVCRQVRRDVNLFTIPVLLLSAMNSEEEILHGLGQGADDYITKPFDINNLLKRTEGLLRTCAESKITDQLTSLPGGEQTKREIQRRTISRESFSVAYIEFMRIREFAYQFGHDARCKAIRRLGRALNQCAADIKEDGVFVGHMGGGHFVCIMPQKYVMSYCKRVHDAWDKHKPAFYQDIGHGTVYQETLEHPEDPAAIPILEVLCCILRHNMGDNTPTPQTLFERLSQIRHRALATNRSGTYQDRRG